MNKKMIKKALERNQCRTYAGVLVPLSHNQHHLVDDLLQRLKRLESDMNKIKPENINELFVTIKIVPDGIAVSWVLVPRAQGNLLATSLNFDEGILQELQEKLVCATLEAVSSIDVGNNLAHESTKSILSADDASQRLNSSKNPRIARNVAARAQGSQVSFVFQEGERFLGGNLAVPHEFTNTERFLIRKCQVTRWDSDKVVLLQTKSLPDDEMLVRFIDKNSLLVRVQRGTMEAAIIDCAALANAIFDIEVSVGMILRSGKKILQLATIQNSMSIFDAAQARLDELKNNQC